MGLAFQKELHDDFGTRPVAYMSYGGADLGEILAVGRAVGSGDDTAFFEAWMAAGDRLAAEAQGAERRNLLASARELHLRASAFYSTAYRPLYGAPTDARLLAAFRKQMAAFDRGLALSAHPVRPMRIALDGAHMPAYLVPAAGQEADIRPLLIFTNGYDATVTDMYFASAVAAASRGYHALVFDGPGQGGMLYEQGVPMRPDWETSTQAALPSAAGAWAGIWRRARRRANRGLRPALRTPGNGASRACSGRWRSSSAPARKARRTWVNWKGP